MKRNTLIGITIIILCSLSTDLHAKVVKLITTGEGTTKEQATNSALRSALAQAFGTFVSSNTSILDDELIKDEIVSLTSGNIESYKELSSTQDRIYQVTLESKVSIEKLISFAQSHGSSAEFAGQTFLVNMRMKELNKKNEAEALDNLITTLNVLGDNLFDYTIKVKEPQFQSNENWNIPIEITTTTNHNYTRFFNILTQTLSHISLSKAEIADYDNNNIPVTEIIIRKGRVNTKVGSYKNENVPQYYKYHLRNSRDLVDKFTNNVCEILNNTQQCASIKETNGRIKCLTPIAHEFRNHEYKNYGLTQNSYAAITANEINLGTEIVKDTDKIGQKWNAEQTQFVNIPEISNFTFPTQTIELPYTLNEIGKVQGFEIKKLQFNQFKHLINQYPQATDFIKSDNVIRSLGNVHY